MIRVPCKTARIYTQLASNDDKKDNAKYAQLACLDLKLLLQSLISTLRGVGIFIKQLMSILTRGPKDDEIHIER